MRFASSPASTRPRTPQRARCPRYLAFPTRLQTPRLRALCPRCQKPHSKEAQPSPSPAPVVSGHRSKPAADFRRHAVALRADVGAQIDLPEGGMGLDAEQPHFAAASRARDAGRFDRFGSDHSHICTVTITWGMSTYTFIQAQTPY